MDISIVSAKMLRRQDLKVRRGEDWRKAAIRFFRQVIRELREEQRAKSSAPLVESPG